MIFRILRDGVTPEALIQLGLYIVIILISLSVHELAHGYVAYRCGDATARNLGRLTLNPLAHLDPIGTIMMLLFGFGYAKPVPVNSRNFNHFKRDLCFVSFAGPFSNMILGLLGIIVLNACDTFATPNIIIGIMNGSISEAVVMPYNTWMFFVQNFIWANLSLCVFNLLPIPPLDGSRIVSTLLPGKIAYYYLRYERYLMLAVMALLYFGILDGILSFLAEYLHIILSWPIERLFELFV